jgi:hypothetical protein
MTRKQGWAVGGNPGFLAFPWGRSAVGCRAIELMVKLYLMYFDVI